MKMEKSKALELAIISTIFGNLDAEEIFDVLDVLFDEYRTAFLLERREVSHAAP